jgi:hypothetical protein
VTEGDKQDGASDTLELINAEFTGRLARQAEAGRGIDTKAGILAGFAAAAAQFLAVRDARPVPAIVALIAYAVAFVLSVWSFAVATYEDVPKPREFIEDYARGTKGKALAGLIVERTHAYESNAIKYRGKAKRWRLALIALGVGLSFSIGAIVQTGDRDTGAQQRDAPSGGGSAHTASAGGP